MTTIPPILVQIQADISNLKSGLAQAEASLKGMDSNVKRTGGMFESFGSTVKRLGVTLGTTFAVGAVVSFFKSSVNAAMEAQAAQSRLRELLLNTAGATRVQIAALEAQADALSKVGFASKENISITQSQLATFDLQGKTISTLTPAILDYVAAEKGATATTQDYKMMTNGLAQALQGNFAALTRVGFVLDDATKKQIKSGTESERAAAIVKVLNSTYKDFNKTLADTPQGRMMKLKQEFDNLKQTIGEALLPLLEVLMKYWQTVIIPVFSKAAEAIKKLTGGLVGGGGLGDSFKKVTTEIKAFFKPLIEMIASLAGPASLSERIGAVVKQIREFFIPILQAIRTALYTVRNAILDSKKSFEGILGTLKEVWAWISKYIIPLVRDALVAAFTIAGRQIATVIKVVVPVIDGILKAVKFVINGIITSINTLISAYNIINNIFGGDDIARISLIGEKAASVTMQLVKMGDAANKTKDDVAGLAGMGGDIWAGTEDPEAVLSDADRRRLARIKDLNAKIKEIIKDANQVRKDAAQEIADLEIAIEERKDAVREAYAESVERVTKRHQERLDDIDERAREMALENEERYADARLEAQKRYTKQQEDIAKDHTKRLLDIEESYIARIKDLEENADRERQKITQDGQSKLAEIVEKGRARLRDAWMKGVDFKLEDLLGLAKRRRLPIADIFKQQLTEIRAFQSQLANLTAQGYSQTFIEQIAQAGPKAGTKMVAQLRQLTPDQRAELQKMYTALEDITTKGVDEIASKLSTSTRFATSELSNAYAQAQVDIKNQLAAVNTALTSNLAEAKSAYDKAIADSAISRDERLAEAKAALDEALADASESYKDAIEKANKATQKALLDADKDFVDGLTEARKDLDKALLDADKAFEKSVKKIAEDTEKRLETLQKALTKTAKQLRELGQEPAVTVIPKPPTAPVVPPIVPDSTYRQGERQTETSTQPANFTFNQTFNKVDASAYQVTQSTLAAAKYGSAIIPAPVGGF